MRSGEVFRRTTFDGTRVLLWGDGALSDRLGRLVPGRIPPALLHLAADEVCTLSWAELPTLVSAAKRARGRDDAELRASLRQGRPREPLSEEESAAILEGESARRFARARAHVTICRGVRCVVCR